MSIDWKDEYCTGDDGIDQQHKVIFQYLADLEAHMAVGDINDRYIKNLLTNLGIFTRSHFCYEEICMRTHRCSIASTNKEHHAKLLAAFGKYVKRFEIEGVSEDLIQKLHDFLHSWLVNHILKIDTQLRDCIN